MERIVNMLLIFVKRIRLKWKIIMRFDKVLIKLYKAPSQMYTVGFKMYQYAF